MNICSLPSECLARIFSLLPDEWARREQLPLTCKAFAAACNDIIWRSVRVDARQYREQTYANISWERVRPWLLRRAGNINGIDLRLSDIRDSRRQSMPPGGVAPLINALPNLKDLTIYLHKPAERYDNAAPEGEAEFVDEALAGATPASPQGHQPGGSGFHDAFHPDDMMGGPPGHMDEDEDEEPDTDEEDEGAVLPPGHMHAEGGVYDSDGDGGGSDSEDSGSEDEDGGPAGQAAAGGAGGGGGGNLGPELQAQWAAINLSLQRTLEANTLLQELQAEWGQQQLADQMAATTAQINSLSQQLNANFLQAAADELDEAAGVLQEMRQALAASVTASLACAQQIFQQAGAAAINPSSSPEAQQFAASVDGAMPAVIATLHQAAAALDGGNVPEAPAAEQPAAVEAGAAAGVAAVDAEEAVAPEHAPAQAGDVANAAPQLAAVAAAAVQALAAAAAALGANLGADIDSEAAIEAADGADTAAAADGGNGAQPHVPDAAAAAAQPDTDANGAEPHGNPAPDVQHAAEHQPMHGGGHVNAAADAAGNVADAAAAEEVQHAEPMEGAEAALAVAANQQQAAEPMDGAEAAAVAAADEHQAAEPMDGADGDAGDAAPGQVPQLAAPAAAAEVPADPAAALAVAAAAEPGGQPGADHEAALAQPQQAPPVAPPPQPWVPPPPPPPLGLDTLGPADFLAIGACRQLRRLELDMSVRSAALAVAAVQLLGSCSHLEELYVEVTVLARDYTRVVLPFPDALLRLSRLRALSLQIPCSAGSMPDSITQLSNLQRLCLNTPFAPKRGLPPGFGALPLASLTLWGGQLGGDHATDELAGLKDLEMLSLGNCGLRAFPTAIAGLTKLQWVDLGHNYGMGESLAAQPATLLTRLTRLATLQVRRSGHWREEPMCIAAMPLLRGSTGLPLPPEFANLDVAEAEDDMAAAFAAASAAGEAAGGDQDPAAAPVQQPGMDDAEEQLLAAALAASLDDQQHQQQGVAAAAAAIAADAGDGGHAQEPQQPDCEPAAAAAPAAAHGPGGPAGMADAAGQADGGAPAATGGGPAAEGGAAPDAAGEAEPMEEDGAS